MADCVHGKQRFVDGAWVCRACGGEVESPPTDPEHYKSIRFTGLEGFRQFRELGQTEQAMTKRNIEEFRKNKGYDPVRVGGY